MLCRLSDSPTNTKHPLASKATRLRSIRRMPEASARRLGRLRAGQMTPRRQPDAAPRTSVGELHADRSNLPLRGRWGTRAHRAHPSLTLSKGRGGLGRDRADASALQVSRARVPVTQYERAPGLRAAAQLPVAPASLDSEPRRFAAGRAFCGRLVCSLHEGQTGWRSAIRLGVCSRLHNVQVTA